MLSNINTNFQALDQMPANAKAVVSDSKNSFINLWDGIFAFLFIGLSLAAVIGAFMIDTHPIFMVLSFILVIAFIIGAAVISNSYFEVESNSAFSGFAEDFRVMHYLLNHLPYYVVVEAVLIMLALYTRSGL